MPDPCPWSWLTEAQAKFCEASLCAWIRQPGNTWSNIGFLATGLFVLWIARRDGNWHLRGVGYISIVTGLGSAAFHATETFWGEFLDYLGMYLGASYMLSVNFRRWRHWSKRTVFLFFWGTFALSMSVMLSSDQYIRSLYIAEALLAGMAEIALFLSKGRAIRYQFLGAFYLAFLPAYTLWVLDERNIWCNPDNHWISGHALWHLGNGLAFYFLYRFYAQFDDLRYKSQTA